MKSKALLEVAPSAMDSGPRGSEDSGFFGVQLSGGGMRGHMARSSKITKLNAPFVGPENLDREAHVQTILPAAEFRAFTEWRRRCGLSLKEALRFAVWIVVENDIRPSDR